VTEIWFRN